MKTFTLTHVAALGSLAASLVIAVPSQQEPSRFLRAADFERHARRTVGEARALEIQSVECPERIPQRLGEITDCVVKSTDGRTVVVHIEQTNDEGSVIGNLDDPEAAVTLKPAQDAFVQAFSGGGAGSFFDSWFSADMRQNLGPGAFAQMLDCRKSAMGQPTLVRRVGATVSPDGSEAVLVLRFQSRARPLRAVLSLTKTEAGWRLQGLRFPPPLPVALPAPAVVESRLRAFLANVDARNWGAALANLSVEFEMARARLRPELELELLRGNLGATVAVGQPKLSWNDDGIIVASSPVRFERAPATVTLQYAFCGERLVLDGYEIAAQPENPLEVTARSIARGLELQLWRRGLGEVKVSCPGIATVKMAPGETVECRAVRGEETVRALIEIKTMAGKFDYRLE